jgi:hypothetical protein
MQDVGQFRNILLFLVRLLFKKISKYKNNHGYLTNGTT